MEQSLLSGTCLGVQSSLTKLSREGWRVVPGTITVTGIERVATGSDRQIRLVTERGTYYETLYTLVVEREVVQEATAEPGA